jgi:hypothetical protein
MFAAKAIAVCGVVVCAQAFSADVAHGQKRVERNDAVVGRWLFNAELSDDAREKVGDAMRRSAGAASSSGPGSGAPGIVGPITVQRVGSGGAAPPPPPPVGGGSAATGTPPAGPRGGGSLEVMSVYIDSIAVLAIESTASGLRIRRDETPGPDLVPDDAEHDVGGSTPATRVMHRTKLDKGLLTVRSVIGQTLTAEEKYFVDAKTGQLVVETKLDFAGRSVKFKRIYDAG